MSDRDAEFPAFGRRSVTDWIVLVSILVGALSVLLVAPAVGESGEAAATLGYILAEALVLYVGYGVLMRVASPTAREILESA
ncbi:hypothetical protein Htur_1031 [Haloterrigena turkmenica DSM 5511]|uniref:Uncharacterized protein n=1 Tax=Haloterrigena turkmenica (strain ATCC 51198 / DSM 5511 / JCM 9101 / NCIMB 13204 / VKM B-1734 / 4k) TaxID=543526 RepID=D2RYM2_HALTV|nr:hypothetical protein [Haloterrigena turkmenica]ADB59923.1 hypothetical protein Htur_1031 [Haloterrigena turkmenica DSM 5511]